MEIQKPEKALYKLNKTEYFRQYKAWSRAQAMPVQVQESVQVSVQVPVSTEIDDFISQFDGNQADKTNYHLAQTSILKHLGHKIASN